MGSIQEGYKKPSKLEGGLMTEVKINKVYYRIPEKKLIAAYAGVHANRYALDMIGWFQGRVSYQESFVYAMNKAMTSIRRQIKDFPKKLTMKQLIKKAPTYWEI